MSKGIATLTIPVSQVKARALEEMRKQFGMRALTRADQITSAVGDFLETVFDETLVARSLRGHGPEDLAAEFGLTDDLAGNLADGMGKLLNESVRLIAGEGGLVLRVQAVPDDWTEYMSLPGASYISFSKNHPAGIEIPVMRWMLLDPNIDFAGAKYDIIYGGGTFTKSIAKVSRSGRALMAKIKALEAQGLPYRPGGYMLPEIVRGNAGKNFIQYAVSREGVAQKAVQIALKMVEA